MTVRSSTERAVESKTMMEAIRRAAPRGRAAILALSVSVMLAAAVAFGGGHDPCREAYLASGLSQQQVTFDEFRGLSGDDVCAPNEEALARVAEHEEGR